MTLDQRGGGSDGDSGGFTVCYHGERGDGHRVCELYTSVYHYGSIGPTVNAIALDITANNQSKNYGEPRSHSPALSSLLALGQLKEQRQRGERDLDQRWCGSAQQTVAGSPYAITASVAVGSGLANYIISYHDGII